MEILFLFWIIIGIILIHNSLKWIWWVLYNSRKYKELKPILDSLEERKREIEKEKLDFKNEKDISYKQLEKERTDLERILEERKKQFPWLIDTIADYYAMLDGKTAAYLKYKKRPAMSAAEIVSSIKEEKRILNKENKFLSYKINYYESLFPWLSDILEDDNIDESAENILTHQDNFDIVKNFVTKDEYIKLSTIERNQLALDRYLQNRKSKWQIWRDYEMYVGYICEQKGFKVEYKWIIDGYEDMWRDIIGEKKWETCIIQCKNWSQKKKIHEKHIFQLFGTTVEYIISQNASAKIVNLWELLSLIKENKVKAIFFTSTSLSEKAKKVANTLWITVIENHLIGDFPRIKCNLWINKEKIYHLPFDQQYDKTIIEKWKWEKYAFTVEEAEKDWFRRALRHIS